jgi:hypothetical protein
MPPKEVDLSTDMKETRTLKIDTPVVVRKVPMSKAGCSNLRAIREYQVKLYSEKHGADVEIPFPTSLHLMMEHYIKLIGIDVVNQEDK